MYFNSTVSKVSTNQLYNRRRDFVLLAEVIFPQQRRNERIERSLHDETLLDNLFRSSVVMISYPNSTLKPIRDLRKYTLNNSEVSTFPQRAFNDSILSAKIVGDIPRSFPRSSILDMPRHEKKNIYSTSICASVLFSCIPKEEFLMRGTDETLMVETAVCPITLI